MKILFITARFPYPPLKGDQTVVYHRLRALSKHHEISLITFFEREEELNDLHCLQPFCKEIHTVKLSKWQSLMNIASLCMFSRLPLQVLYYQSADFHRKIDLLMQRNNYDVVHTFLLRMAPYLKKIHAPKVLELIDSMQLNLQRRIMLEPIFTNWLLREELRRVAAYEKNIDGLAEHLIVVAEKDKEFLHDTHTSVIPNGVDTDAFSPADHKSSELRVIFSGNMGYAPNIHAVKWFVEHCWPYIRTHNSEAVLTIAGGNVSSDIKLLDKQHGITVTGYVPSMAEVLRTSMVAIAPMQSGSGIQNKILEAMACALPVVTTSLGLGSIKACHNDDIFVYDDPAAFSRCVLDLLVNPAKANAVGQKARKYVEAWHSWERAAETVDEIYRSVVYDKECRQQCKRS